MSAPNDTMPVSSERLGHSQRCPLCAQENACQVSAGGLYKGTCWCEQIAVPQQLLKFLAEQASEPACLCRPCLETLARLSQERTDFEAILKEARLLVRKGEPEGKEEPDFYLDEFGNTVFTAAYHLKRGNCCENQCRHCPY